MPLDIKAPDIVSSGDLGAKIGSTGTAIANLAFLLAGAIAIGSLIGYGIMFITSGGDANRLTTAKKGIMYSILGIAVITLTLVIVNLIRGVAAI